MAILNSNQAVLYKCQGQTLIVCKHFYASISEERGGDFIKVHSAHVA